MLHFEPNSIAIGYLVVEIWTFFDGSKTIWNIRIYHLFKPVTQNQYSRHPTHSLDHVTYSDFRYKSEKSGISLMLVLKGKTAPQTKIEHVLCAISNSYTPRTLRACCSQSKFRILKIRESSMRALFLYNCTLNISRSADGGVSVT